MTRVQLIWFLLFLGACKETKQYTRQEADILAWQKAMHVAKMENLDSSKLSSPSVKPQQGFQYVYEYKVATTAATKTIVILIDEEGDVEGSIGSD